MKELFKKISLEKVKFIIKMVNHILVKLEIIKGTEKVNTFI